MPLTLPDGLQCTKADRADIRYLRVVSSTQVVPLYTQLVGVQLIHELA